ncbi:hypothetical protein D3C72_2231000 [compost metagenome]
MTMSAPSSLSMAALAAPAVVATVAPMCLANWIAMVPTPPEPACISTFWPAFSCPFSTRTCHAVSAASGIDAASSIVSVAGLCASAPSLTAMNSANVPMRSSSGRA